ncbi:MAG: glycosyltransferase family 39 protein [Chloroflexota bacterium]|nr:glycosyltransferase family 39 protein [Chloroflexota bacterium]
MTAVNLFQAAIGLASIAGVAGLGWLLAGRFAAVIAASVFGAMPLVLWELGHAFIDMLPVLLTTSAMACIIIWQRHNSVPWLVLAGALTGTGVSTKLNMAALILAIAASVFLVGREPWNLRERVATTLAFSLGALTMVPWLAHLALRTGTLPGLDALMSRISRVSPLFQSLSPDIAQHAEVGALSDGDTSEVTGPPADWVAFGHSPLDIVRLPWTLTFGGERFAFPVVGRGEVGVATLLLIPFSIFGSRQRTAALLALVAAISYLAWWLTPYQVSRHLLPTLAILAALGGSGVATLAGLQNGPRWQGALKVTALGALLFTIALTPIFFVSGTRTQMPIALLTGAQSREAYIRSSITAAVPLLASSDMLAPDTPVAFLGGMWDAPQIYTEARLVFFDGNDAGATPEAVLSTLEQNGVRYIIWNRGTSPTRDSSSTIRSTPFLRQYTRILAGDHDAYLFEVLPAGDTIWGQQQVTNLLEDPGLQDVKSKKGPWATEGKSIIAQGVVALSRRATLTQEVAVTPGHAYVLEAPIRCLDASGRGILTFRWLDAEGSVIDTESEEVLPGREITDQFLWRRAPDGAASVQAEFSMAGPSRCEFSGAALYDLG